MWMDTPHGRRIPQEKFRFDKEDENTALEITGKRDKIPHMKASILALASLFALPTAHAQNMATAEWIPESVEVAQGKEFRTVVRLKINEGWHTYWENPGEGGLPIAVKAELPEGWTLGKIQFPAPIAFKTGPLSGYGYEGEVLFPLTITPPPGSGATELPEGIVAKITWLTCNDKSCVPGKTEASPTPAQPELVEKAFAALPEKISRSTLSCDTSGDDVKLALTLPADSKLDPTSCKVFPVTRNVIDPSAKSVFGKDASNANTWVTTAPKSEYLDGTPDSLSLVLVDADGKAWVVYTATK